MTAHRTVILVPRRAGVADRDALWEHCRAWWSRHFPEYHLVEGTHDDGPFNRAVALNRAAAAAGDWDVAVCIDADVLLEEPRQLRTAVQLCAATGGPVLAFDERVMLTQRGTKGVMAQDRGSWVRPGFVERIYRDSCSCCYVVSRDVWDLVGGFDESFAGWGYEDTAFRCATETASGREMANIKGRLYHLHHRAVRGTQVPEYAVNRARADQFAASRWNTAQMSQLLGRQLPEVARHEPGWPVYIPKILHRTVPHERNPEVERFWHEARRLHPEWDCRTHRDPIDPDGFPLTHHLWERCSSGAQLAGLIRLEALFHVGGIYVDSDVQLLRPLDSLTQCSAFAAWEDGKVCPDAVIGARPGHPAIQLALAEACAAVAAGEGAWVSGPGVTTKVFPGREDVLLLPPGSFYPVHYRAKNRCHEYPRNPDPWAFGIHHWHHSWKGA